MNSEQFFNNGFGADVEKVHRKHVIDLMTNFAKHYHTEQCTIPVVRCSFYEFAKQYVTIKDTEGNEQKFSDKQLNEIKEMEEMMNKGYEFKFVHLRRGTELRWVKK